MQGIHDLGGLEGLGPVAAEADEPVFHYEWERRTLGLVFATFLLGLNRGGQFRHAIERMDPGHYLTSPYYEHWLTGLATRLVERGRLTVEELEDRAGGPFPLSRPVAAPDAAPDASADAAAAAAATAPRFALGAVVRVRRIHTRGHSRCPAYVQGRVGTVVRVDRRFAVPDVDAHLPDGAPAPKEPTYSVRFDATELWGAPGDPVHVDLWEAYLDAA